MGLTSRWFVLAVALLAATAVAAAPVTWDRWRRPAVARTGLVLTATALVLLAVAALVNALAGFYPNVSSVLGNNGARLQVGRDGVLAMLQPAGQTYDLAPAIAAHVPGRGVTLGVQLTGPGSGIRRPAAVYLPDAYFDPAPVGVRFPVIEVLSGSPGNPGQMLRELTLAQTLDDAIAAHRLAPTIAVVPDTNGSVLRDRECADKAGGVQDETYLAREVPDLVSAQFRTLPVGSGWALLGTSTGGYCALDLLLRNPDRFAAAASLSGYVHALTDPTTGSLYANRADRDAHDPIWRLQHCAIPARSIWLSAGTAEASARRDVAELASVATGPLHLTTVLVPGAGHSFSSWRAVLPQALAFLSGTLPPALAPTPILPGQDKISAAAHDS